MKVLILGDIHAEFGQLNTIIDRKKPELVICCGDYGFWPSIKTLKQFTDIKPQSSKILWIDGNHEDFWALKQRASDEIVPNVIYMPRGSTYDLPDGRRILFMGGADSIDKNYRKLGVDWFPEEVITQKDIYNLPDTKIDILISHTCSNEIRDEKMIKLNPLKLKDPSNDALSYIWNKYRPKLWFFGHWHRFVQGGYQGTLWWCLSHPGEGSRWWIWLPEKK
jgi:predicted phosphodiesterase